MVNQLQVENLQKRYGQFEAVRGVSFNVGAGEIFGLLGPNGAGKTSTVECVIGLRRPDGGSVRLCGMDAIEQPEAVKERIGVALQSTSLQDKITPREALSLFGSFYRNRVASEKLLERFALIDKANASFDSLSGGQKQRLALALAFVNEPEVLFLDEPTTGLDPQSRRELHQSILQMRQEGRTVILTTHYIEEAHELCDRIAIIDRGRVIAEGKPNDLIAKAKSSQRVTVRTARPLAEQELRSIPSVDQVQVVGDGVELKTSQVSQTVIELVKLIEAQGNELVDLHIRRPSLEDVFIELTGAEIGVPNAERRVQSETRSM